MATTILVTRRIYISWEQALRISFKLIFLAWALLSGCGEEAGPGPYSSLDPIPSITTNENSPIGTVVNSFSYYRNSEYMTVDTMLRSSDWFASTSSGFNDGLIVSVDANGWPTSVASDTTPTKLFFGNIEGQYPSGTYVVLWDIVGDGASFEFGQDAADLRCENGTGTIANCSTGRALFDVETPTDEGFSLEMARDMTASSHVTNMRIILPGGVCGRTRLDLDPTEYCESDRGGTGSCDGGETCFDFEEVYWNRYEDSTSQIHNPKILYHPAMLDKLQPYATVRTMDILGINFGNSITDWSTITPVGFHTQGIEDGAHPIYAIALANAAGADLWLNIPHQATDNYVSSMVDLINDELNITNKVYVEYSNEVWNPTDEYPQSDYALDQANLLALGNDGDDERTLRGLYNARRTGQVMDIFNDNIDDPLRLVRVLGTWIVFSDLTRAMLNFEDTASKVDVVAIGAYLAGYLGEAENTEAVEGFSVDDFFREMYNGGLVTTEGDPAVNGSIAEVRSYMNDQITVTNEFDVGLVAYEGGTHTWNPATESNSVLRELFQAAHRDDRMGDVYTTILNHWRSIGGQLWNNFKSVGTWELDEFGVLEYQEDSVRDSVRYEALIDFINANPCWWSNCD